jgi:hypothetical protein
VVCTLDGLDGLDAHVQGATGRWRGRSVLFFYLCQEQESVFHIVVHYAIVLSKRALFALAKPDTKDQFDSCMRN